MIGVFPKLAAQALCRLRDTDKAQHHVDDIRTALGQQLRAIGVALEDQAEGVAVGDIEKAQRRDGGVDVDGIQPGAELAAGEAALVELLDGADRRFVELLDQLALRQVLAALDVLVHHQRTPPE